MKRPPDFLQSCGSCLSKIVVTISLIDSTCHTSVLFVLCNVVFSYSKFCFEQQFTENLEHVSKCIV